MVRAVPYAWPGLIGRCRSNFPRKARRSLTGRSGIMKAPTVTAISFPESSFPLTSGRKKRALGATISGMHHRCRLRSEPDGQNSVISFVISKWLLREPSFSDRWSKGTKTLGTRLRLPRRDAHRTNTNLVPRVLVTT